MIKAAAWTPLEFTKTIRTQHAKTPKKIHVNGKNLAVFWDSSSNTPAIVNDTCTHRGASLSAGGQVDGKCVTCKYHGRPTRALPSKLVMDFNNIVWFKDGPGELGEDERLPPDSWEFHPEAGQRIFEYSRTFAGCNPILLVENTLDFAHLETVHAFSLVEGRPIVTVDQTGYNGHAKYTYDSKVFDELSIVNEYIGPWSTCLRFLFDGRQSFTIHFSVRPEGVDQATLFVRVTRQDQKWLGWLGDKVYLAANELPLLEDLYIVKNTDPMQWSANKLTADDFFLKEYRAYMTREHPDILERYVK